MVNKKKILFVHQNFPGQYKHIYKSLVKKGFDVHSLSIKKYNGDGINNHYYELLSFSSENINQWAQEFEAKIIRADSALKKCLQMRDDGFYPDLIIGHPGWGETFFMKEVWPESKLLTYVEFYYKTINCDIDFDKAVIEDDLNLDFDKFYEFNKYKLTARNSPFLSTYALSDYLVSPTQFQKNLVPKSLRDNIEVIHDGIDTEILKPDPKVKVLVNGKKYSKSDKIITYVSRSLDPYRGFHIFMKAIPKILKENPDASIFIVGDDKTHGYGAKPKGDRNYKEIYYSKIKDQIKGDEDRLFFFGQVQYDLFIKLMQISSIHIYLSYPFVLSWSMLEAMSCGATIIGSNTSPVTEVIEDNTNGLLVDFFDYEGISANVHKVLKNRDKYKNLSTNARQTIIEKYDLKKVALPLHLDLINRALK